MLKSNTYLRLIDRRRAYHY